MKLSSQDLEKITDLTLSHYNELAEEFWEGTRDHNVHQNIAALLQCIEGEPPFTILDFGCGPGRDLKAFAELGHIAVGLEGAAHFAEMARAHRGCEVWQQDFSNSICRITVSMVYSLMPRYFMYPARSYRACCWNCARASNRVVCCSARTRTVITRKAGMAGATARIMILIPGAAMCQLRDLLNLITITDPPDCRAKSNPG